jgi:peptidoglycan/xylan/chitin deacetylase (PgdA/CDA1 family)
LAGNGVILMLHHVVPGTRRPFEPNGILKVTPEFLQSVIEHVHAAGFEIIPLNDVKSRLTDGASKKPFVVFTLDDGYKDNRDFAYPVFKRYGVPFTIYVPAAFADGEGELWWLALEEALRRLPRLAVEHDRGTRTYSLLTDEEKTAAFGEIYWWLRSLPEDKARALTRTLAAKAGFNPTALCRQLVMSWDELRVLARDPLVTIGAHTCRHYSLAKLPRPDAQREIAESLRRIEDELGSPCRHFSYPYGDETSAGEREFEIARELGVETAVTTRKGMVRRAHASTLTALPRLSLNGDFQDIRYVKVLLSGLPFALRDAATRIVTPLVSALRPM